MNLLSSDNKIFKKIGSRNKSNHNLLLRNKSFSSNKLYNVHYLSNNNIKNILYSENKSTNFLSSNNITKTNINKNTILKFNNNRKSSYSKRERILLNSDKNTKNISTRILRFSKNFFDKKINSRRNNSKSNLKERDMICILPNYLTVKNFSLKTPKVMDYLGLNQNNNLFLCENNLSKIHKLSKNYDIEKRNKKLKRNASFSPINRSKKIEDIYPTVFNIEGKKNRKLIEELKMGNKTRKQKVILNNKIKNDIENIKKIIIQNKNKIEDEKFKSKISDIEYRRQLILSKLKFFKKNLNHLRMRISPNFNLELPLYNLFLNLEY